MIIKTFAAAGDFDPRRLLAMIADQVDEKVRDIGRFNLLCIGNTGAGKSTLINAVFGSDAHTGIGRPVTKGTTEYVHPQLPLTVLDTRGIEVGEDRRVIAERLVAEIKSRRSKPVAEQIHVAWYCVRATDVRLEDGQIEVIKAIQDAGVPVLLVMTRVPFRSGDYHPDAQDFAQAIVEMDLPLAGGVPIMTAAIDDPWGHDKAHGLQELLDATFRVAPDGVHAALTAAQQIDIDRKWARTNQIIAGACTAAGAAAAIPIPFSDAAIIVPAQIAMIAGITAAWGLKLDRSVQATVIGSALLTGAATFAGREVVANVLKLIPLAGWFVGAAIGASVAVALTTAVGQAWGSVVEQLSKDPSRVPEMPADEIKAMFEAAMRRVRSKDPKAA